MIGVLRLLVDVDWHGQLFLRLPVDVDIGVIGFVAVACRCQYWHDRCRLARSVVLQLLVDASSRVRRLARVSVACARYTHEHISHHKQTS